MSKRRFPLKKFPELLKNPPPDVDIMLYDKKKEGSTSTGDHTVKQSRMDRLEESIAKLAKIVSDGFSEVRQDIKGLKQDVKDINTRLDYIVKANNLKDNK